MHDPISQLNAALEGRYTIERELGQGGMATVYLARDVKHNRNVALKVLKPELAAVVGAERFLTEIETTANLQHPHILPLFDSGQADTFLFFVMPYIEGETLRDKIDREKQLPVDEAIGITIAVANALQVAHEAGVIHRDIKPANIMLSRGEPLVTDFGISLAVGAASGNRLTETGLSIGTPYYMSPEQATGDQALGPTTDTYALACVLYEMLVGEPPYMGSTAQAVLGKIIQGAPVSATLLRPSIPRHVDAAIRRGLEKIPADRFTSARGFAAALGDRNFTHGESSAIDGVSSSRRHRLVTRGWMAGAAVMAGLAAWGWLRPEAAPIPTRAIVDIGDIALTIPDEVLVSPDGTRFAFSGRPEGGERAVYVRSAGEADFRLVPGTEGAEEAAFSPDGEWIAYKHTDNRFMKVYLLGGAPAVVPTGGIEGSLPYWGSDRTIVFGTPTGLFRVPDSGGEPEQIWEGSGLFDAVSLPGGRYVLATNQQIPSVEIIDVDSKTSRTLKTGAFDATYVEALGQLLYADPSGVLWAAPFEVKRGEITGPERPVVEGVTNIGNLFARYSVSRSGTLIYASGGVSAFGGARRVVQVTLDGVATAMSLEPRRFANVRWSPDGRSVAFQGSATDGSTLNDVQIYTYDAVQRSQPRQLTTDGGNGIPVWSPDGSRIAFTSGIGGSDPDVFIRDVAGTAPPQRVLTLPGFQTVTDWPEANTLFIVDQGNLHILDLSGWPAGDSVAHRPFFESEAALGGLVLAPQGDLAAYWSRETGTNEVYVKSYPEPLSPERVSDGGGTNPMWSPDGKTIYYWWDQSVFAAHIQREPTFAVLARERLFSWSTAQLSLHPDGDRFVSTESASTDDAPAPAERHFVIVNWFEELKQRMGR